MDKCLHEINHITKIHSHPVKSKRNHADRITADNLHVWLTGVNIANCIVNTVNIQDIWNIHDFSVILSRGYCQGIIHRLNDPFLHQIVLVQVLILRNTFQRNLVNITGYRAQRVLWRNMIDRRDTYPPPAWNWLYYCITCSVRHIYLHTNIPETQLGNWAMCHLQLTTCLEKKSTITSSIISLILNNMR